MSPNTAAAINIGLTLVAQGTRAFAMAQQATAEGRDVTDAELEQLAKSDDASRERLVGAIADAKRANSAAAAASSAL